MSMLQMFDEKGKVVPVTLVQAGPCKITQVKTEKTDGYNAVQIGFSEKKKKVKKTEKGKEFKLLKEFALVGEKTEYKLGDTVDVSVFSEGDKVNVSGISKGKGFQGGIKRWGFAGKGASHGVKHEHRTIGSVGRSFPERVTKGKKMPGHLGQERVQVKNLTVIKADKDKNILALKGAVPGAKGTLLEVKG